MPITTCGGIVEGDAGELLARPGVELALQRLPSLELALVHPDGEAEAGLERIVLGVDVLAPQPIALLEAKRVERAAAGRDDPVHLPGLPQNVPGSLSHRDLPVELPTELAGVGDPLRPDGIDLADVQVASGHVRERVVGDVDVRHGLEDVAGARSPQTEREERSRADREVDPFAVAPLGEQPRAVVLPRPAPGDDAETILVLPGDGEVAPDASRRREHRGVDDRPDGTIDPVGADALEERERICAGDVELGEGRDVEEPDALARGDVLRPDARRPVLRRPALPRFPWRAGQHVVRLEPLRPLPAGAREELGAEVPVARVERASASARADGTSAGADGGCRRPRGTAGRRARGRTASSS